MSGVSKGSRITMAIFGAGLLGCGAIAVFLAVAFMSTPDFKQLTASIEMPVKRADGSKTTRKFGPQAPGWVPLSGVSNNLLMAVIASEDASFYSHEGVDYFELREAIKKDLKEKRWARGASTLTQQVVKNAFLTPEKTLTRKLREVIWAQKIEKELTKSQILCFYVNMAEWGPGIYGIGQASNHYFGVPPSMLTPKQSAFLAMLLPAPTKYYAYYRKREVTPWAQRRMNQILRVMNRMGYIDGDAYRLAHQESVFGETPLEMDPDAVPSGDDSDLPTLPSSLATQPKTAPNATVEAEPPSSESGTEAVPQLVPEAPQTPAPSTEDQ